VADFMLLFYFSISLAILFSVLYHLFQKFTPISANPALAFAVTYATAFVACLALLPLFPPKDGLSASLKQLNWASIALGLAIVGLEIGFLLVYRSGWSISVAGTVANAASALILIPIGLLIFKDKVTPLNLIGVVVCIAGLVMNNQK
jgi:multidrug transporter EmrE-like cation transporter